MELELSKTTEKYESQWNIDTEKLMQLVVEKLNETLQVNLTELNKSEDKTALGTFKYFRIFLLDKYKDSLYNVLINLNINIEDFEREIILSFILSITRNKSNVEFLKDLLIRNHIINSYEETKEEIVIETPSMLIKFSKFDEQNKDELIERYKKENENIYSSCHESTEFLLNTNKEFIAVTGICEKNLGQKYFHSVILDGEYVIDLTSNLYIKKEDYYKLYKFTELNRVTYDEFLSESEDSKTYDESGTLFPLLRNAIYKQEKGFERKTK